MASLGSCPAGDKDEADFCLATDVRLAACKAAKAAIAAMGGHGVLVHLTGNNVDANTQLRIKGGARAVRETGGKVKLLQTKQCSVRDPGVRVDSGSFVVDRANVSAYDTARQAKTAQLKQQFADRILNCA